MPTGGQLLSDILRWLNRRHVPCKPSILWIGSVGSMDTVAENSARIATTAEDIDAPEPSPLDFSTLSLTGRLNQVSISMQEVPHLGLSGLGPSMGLSPSSR